MKKAIKVLVVDDSEADAELAVLTLRRGGFEVQYERVQSAAEMGAALRRQAWDAVISDFGMPGFTGLDALRIFQGAGADIPFILISGTIGEETAVDAMKAGASDYLMKDNLARLAPALKRELQQAAMRDARRQAERDRIESESLKGAILESSLDGVVTIDHLGNIVEFNPSAAAIFGIPRERALGRPMAELIVPPRLRAAHHRGFDHYLATGEGPILGKRLELEAIRADGTEFPIELAITAIPSPSGTLFTAFIRDITARKEAEARIRRLNRVHAVLSGINALIVRVRDREELFEEACRIAVDAGQFVMAWIGLADRETKRVKPVAWGGDAERFLASAPLSLGANRVEGHGMSGSAIKEKRAMVANDVQSDPRTQMKEQCAARGINSLAFLPLIVGNEGIGLLALYAAEMGFFDEEEMKLLLELAGDISFALDHIEKAEKIEHLAYHDSLTGLANHTLFRDRLAQYVSAAQSDRSKLAVAVMDVDRFKTINDTLGRQAGDELLRQIAGRIENHAGPVRMTRINADRFAIVRSGVSSESEVARIIEQWLAECFGLPYVVGGTELRVSAKAGIALYPNDGEEADTLFQNAEAALKKAKAAGERYLFHAPQMTERVAEKLALENRLRRALEKEEFVLHYQPKVDTATRRLESVEALIRWQSPELGLVPPMQFIPLLEETGLILEVGAWALGRAVLDHRGWRDRGLSAPRISVNVSAVQLRQRDFVATVEDAIRRGEAPSGIDLEITESLVMEDVEANAKKLEAVRRFGVTIAVDDFGTGYSSLGYLAKLPVHSLKIDRSFIITMLRDPNIMTLVSTIISLAHSLNLQVVAEGVDAEDQAGALKRLGCDQMQGFLFSRPVPADQIVAMLPPAG